MANACKVGLSKNLLEMKFMKKTKEKVEIEKLQNEQKILFDGDVTQAMRNFGNQFIMESGYVSCEDLISGRMSFRGANPEIEQMMRNVLILRQEKEIEEREAKGTISAEQMADRYSSLIDTIDKKFKTKRAKMTKGEEIECKDEHANLPVMKKTKFMKPND